MPAPIGREVALAHVGVAGVVSCVPRNALSNEQCQGAWTAAEVADVIRMIGVQSRRRAPPGVGTGDLCRAAAGRLLGGLGWAPESVDALILVTQTPNYRLPATACVLQAALGLSTSCMAFDVNLGCSGYPYALWLGMSLIRSGSARRVLLLVGDTISRVVDPHDRATALLFGDAGSATALEDDSGAAVARFILGTDGAGATNLIVPSGGCIDYADSGDERLKGRDTRSLYMDGGEIFNFTLRTIPDLVARTAELGGAPQTGYDFYLFHQANAFMLRHLVKKARLAAERVPMNIEEFGNTSSASIPLLMTTRIAARLREGACRIAMFGFGVGYSWASADLDLGPLRIIETIEL